MSKVKAIPPSLDEKGYTVKEANLILNLQDGQTRNVFKIFGVKKIKNVYYANLKQIEKMLNRKNRCIKDYDL